MPASLSIERSIEPDAVLELHPADRASTRHGVHHRALVAIGLLSVAGTATELTVLGHYSSATQLIPYVAIAVLACGLWKVRRAVSRRAVVVLRSISALTFMTALLGGWFHFNANLELSREIDPTRHGLRYLWSGVTGKIPFLAPLVLAQIALLLLAATVAHPRRHSASVDESRTRSR